MSDIRLLGLKQVKRDGGTQSRERMDPDHVAELAEWLREHPGEHLRPIKVVSDLKRFWLHDGFHRLEAYRQAGRTEIPAEVVRGTQRDAVFLSAAANTDIVLKRTPADKWCAVEMLLDDPEWRAMPDGKIADHCGVGRKLVMKIRQAHLVPEDKIAEPMTRTAHRGNATYTMEVGPIGKRLGAAMPPPKAEPEKPPEQEAACKHRWVKVCERCGERCA